MLEPQPDYIRDHKLDTNTYSLSDS